MAIEDLLNNPTHQAVLSTMWDGLRSGADVGGAFSTALASAPVLSHYGGNAQVVAAGGLGRFVTKAWFDNPPGSGYWLDYGGPVDEIVREALLFAMELAGADRAKPLPSTGLTRPIELLWHCGQRWFETWLTWEDETGPISVLFASPPHAAGVVLSSVLDAPPGQATAVTPKTAAAAGDMVLITAERHRTRRFPILTFWGTGRAKVPLPAIGVPYEGVGNVGAWSIEANSGGARPRTGFG